MTGLLYDPTFLLHDTGPGHAERPDRLRAVITRLQETGLWDRCQHLPFHPASEDNLRSCHTPLHIELVRSAFAKGLRMLDEGDTFVSEHSFEAAMLAVGSVLTAIDAVAANDVDNAFCLVRPPGHHAETSRPMGFCLFNSVAIGARYARQHFGMDRIAILDWDVHHGNGTQEIFYQDPSVLYISTHQSPLYPGTGARDERGEGPGEGYTLNIPMFAGAGEAEFLNAFRKDIIPALDHFRPELLLLSAGFDAHRDDPLANLALTEESFGLFTELMMELADRHCDGRIVSVLEGGYNLAALAASVEAHILRMMTK